MVVALIAAAVNMSCDGSSDLETQVVTLGPLEFEVPVEWQRANSEPSGTASATWAPVASSNERKESITVIRSPMHRTREQLMHGELSKLLAGAQGSLPGARVSAVASITTRRQLSGAQINVTFQVGDGGKRYRRVHAVLVDAETSGLVHVLYTAASPDPDLRAFYTVLETLQSEEG